MVMEKDAFATLGGCSESATATLKVEPPEAVGVPDTTPARLRLSPGGKFPDAIPGIRCNPAGCAQARVYGALITPCWERGLRGDFDGAMKAGLG